MSGQSPQSTGGLSARFGMWRARRAPAVAKGFVSQPEPRSIGLYARGNQLLAGNFFVAGQLVTAPNTSIWDIPMPRATGAFTLPDDRTGFAWLDDLAAVADAPARKVAQDWTFEWIKRFGAGRGNGWSADLTGRRLIRWVNHAPFLLTGRRGADSARFFAEASAQVYYLSRQWPKTPPGIARIEALTGLIYAGLSLDGLAEFVPAAETALAKECDRGIAADGGIATRSPEELLEVFTLLTWAPSSCAHLRRLFVYGLHRWKVFPDIRCVCVCVHPYAYLYIYVGVCVW